MPVLTGRVLASQVGVQAAGDCGLQNAYRNTPCLHPRPSPPIPLKKVGPRSSRGRPYLEMRAARKELGFTDEPSVKRVEALKKRLPEALCEGEERAAGEVDREAEGKDGERG